MNATFITRRDPKAGFAKDAKKVHGPKRHFSGAVHRAIARADRVFVMGTFQPDRAPAVHVEWGSLAARASGDDATLRSGGRKPILGRTGAKGEPR